MNGTSVVKELNKRGIDAEFESGVVYIYNSSMDFHSGMNLLHSLGYYCSFSVKESRRKENKPNEVC